MIRWEHISFYTAAHEIFRAYIMHHISTWKITDFIRYFYYFCKLDDYKLSRP